MSRPVTPGRTIGAEAHARATLRELRTTAGFTYAQMADEMTAVGCAIPESAVWKIENANRRIDADEFCAIAAVFDLALYELAGWGVSGD